MSSPSPTNLLHPPDETTECVKSKTAVVVPETTATGQTSDNTNEVSG
jgi:hypothetical protein